MDPITHGIAGALLGKAYFTGRKGREASFANTKGRVAIFAATLGAVFPDIDIIGEVVSRDPLAIVKYHRGITHSFVGLPFFAALLAWLTRWLGRRRGIETPSWAMLTLIYGIGIASHIVLDGMTSFGTRMWTPISQQRVAWDLLFIIDFSFTAIILLPQIAAWIYSDRAKSLTRAIWMWVLFTLGAMGAWTAASAAGFPFHLWIAALASAIIAALFFLPGKSGWGFGVKRSSWCQAGTYAMIAYLFACGMAHHAAMKRVEDFASANKITIDRLGALPLPPSLLDWGGVIRTTDGVYQARFDLRTSAPPMFHFAADSPPDRFIARALQLPEVRLFWNFARFPVIHSFAEDGEHIVDIGENRFVNTRRKRPQPFTYRLIFDSSGDLLEEGWQSDGMFLRHMQKLSPQRSGETP
ncbi:MAG: metal-dependent hydrolase [Candidatus Acidiferrales bacterium]